MFDDLVDDLAEEGTVITRVVTVGGERLDKWLAGQLPEHSRAEIQRWIADDLVTARNRPLKASYRVTAGDEVTVVVPPVEDYAVEPEAIPLEIVFEDADLLVINKPAGMVVHPAAGNWHGTLVNAVLYHCPDLEGVGGAHRPGIVHRLDKDTSGLILVAKNDAAHRALQAQFKARTVHKTYLALVHGWLRPERGAERGEINAPIGRDPRNRQRMAVVSLSQGRAAVTQYEVRQYLEQVMGNSRGSGASDARYTLVGLPPAHRPHAPDSGAPGPHPSPDRRRRVLRRRTQGLSGVSPPVPPRRAHSLHPARHGTGNRVRRAAAGRPASGVGWVAGSKLTG